MSKICIIGGGNLGRAVAEGLINAKYCKPELITICRRNISSLHDLAQKKCKISTNNIESAKNADIIFLCVKPFQAKDVLSEIAGVLKKDHLLISTISGVTIEEIAKITRGKATIFRAMPNTAISIQQSITCISFSKANGKEEKIVSNIFDQLGTSIVIDEKLMDAATVLGACGTAFAMRYIRANIQAGIEIGFDAKTAGIIVAQTVKGAADLLIKNNSHPEEEIDKVTTPKGVTITGLNQMEHQGLSSSIIKGITEAHRKISN